MRVVVLSLVLAAGAILGCGAAQPKTNALGMTELTQADLDGPSDKKDAPVAVASTEPNPDQYDVTIAPSPEPPERKPPRPRHMKPPTSIKHGTMGPKPPSSAPTP